MQSSKPIVVLEEASLELVPKNFMSHESCRLVQTRFGIPPEVQILDDNFHHEIIRRLSDQKKRGRPDIVHFALLDITSTPAFIKNQVEVYVHTISNQTIRILNGVRLPRTLLRFYGVISKVLSGNSGSQEQRFFELTQEETSSDLIFRLRPQRVICLTTEGKQVDIISYVKSIGSQRTIWIIGGFSHGHFSDDLKSAATDLVSISSSSLAAHVVAARLCFAIELSML